MIRYYNAQIMPMQNGTEIIRGELWTEGDTVVYVGEEPQEKPVFTREIDCKGHLLMPSFKNAHTHSAMTFLRSFAEDVPLQTWLFEKVFPYEDRLTPEDVYAFDRLAILEYLAAGTTAVFDMYFFPEASAQAFIESGMRLVFCGSISGTAKDVERLNDQYQTYRAMHPRIAYRLGFHAEYTSDESLHREVARLAQAESEPVYTHISETKKEHDECIERHGASPAQYLDSLGLWEYGGGGFHAVWFDEKDRDLFAKKGLWFVSCPCSNAKLASGIAPLKECIAQNVSLALGTDGPASNNALDMFREMYLAAVLQKLRTNDAAAIPAAAMLTAATVSGAQAMGLNDCDILAPGKQADFILVDTDAPNLQPAHHIPESLVLSGDRMNVEMTVCAGEILYDHGSYLTLNAGEILADCAKRIARLTG